MKPLSIFGVPGPSASIDQKLTWLVRTVQQLAQNSQLQDTNAVADRYTFSNNTTLLVPVRALDVRAGTLDDVKLVLATFLGDLQRREGS